MNRKRKVIAVSFIIILLSIVGIILIYKFNNTYNSYTATILDIKDNIIIVEDTSMLIPYELYNGMSNTIYGHEINIEGNKYVSAKYEVYTDGTFIIDINGNDINVTDLTIGDTILIITKDEPKWFSNEIRNTKWIKVLTNNSNNQ